MEYEPRDWVTGVTPFGPYFVPFPRFSSRHSEQRQEKKSRMEAKNELKSAPFNLQMDAQMALGLVQRGATLLLLDVPQYTLVSIDTQMFSVGPVFKGIKMIPPGPHFVYYSSSNSYSMTTSRNLFHLCACSCMCI
ncbi:uncharacterized protein LOC122084739 [Macadamia integrifolia]|uniref:uncharacterized protein LOC122084739 n=1 Tax=Macadamia integrifolia TaxID=60698 RepID=UPI001C4F3BD2|nr:uncharacterized protein LOC122084739 [Macadamia integrifolia]